MSSIGMPSTFSALFSRKASEISNPTIFQASSRDILFVDAQVPNYQQLIAETLPGIEIFILDSQRNGIQQITEILSQSLNFSKAHIVSHGSPGCLYLGNSRLSLDTLDDYAEQLRSWFSETLMLYGCNVAAGDAGAEFLEKLQRLTGSAIAASTTPIGHGDKGGNWMLDSRTPNADVELAFNAAVQMEWAYVLDPLEEDFFSILPGQSVNLDVLGNDDPGEGPFTIVDVSDPPNGTASINNSGGILYTAGSDFEGADNFTYTVTSADGNVLTGEVTANVDVTEPFAVSVMVEAEPGIPETIDVLANSSDPNGDLLTIVNVTQPLRGIVEIDDNGTRINPSDDVIIYTPDPDFVGTYHFDYTITDSDGNAETAVVTVAVESDQNLVANDDNLTVVAGQLGLVTPLSNDIFFNGDAMIQSFDTTSVEGGSIEFRDSTLLE
ncbi:MAG: DUF4347 domain-containing protein [Microcoleaceae cyanobacterium]